MAITPIQRIEIISKMESGGERMKVADKVGCAYNTVKRTMIDYANGKIDENGNYIRKKEIAKLQNCKNTPNLLQQVAKIKKEQNKQLLDVLRDDNRPLEIVSKILNLMNDEPRLKKELDKKGMGGLNTIIGTMLDKGLKFADLQLKRESAEYSNRLNETYDPNNDNFKKAAVEALKNINVDDVMSYVDKESMEEDSV